MSGYDRTIEALNILPDASPKDILKMCMTVLMDLLGKRRSLMTLRWLD